MEKVNDDEVRIIEVQKNEVIDIKKVKPQLIVDYKNSTVWTNTTIYHLLKQFQKCLILKKKYNVYHSDREFFEAVCSGMQKIGYSFTVQQCEHKLKHIKKSIGAKKQLRKIKAFTNTHAVINNILNNGNKSSSTKEKYDTFLQESTNTDLGQSKLIDSENVLSYENMSNNDSNSDILHEPEVILTENAEHLGKEVGLNDFEKFLIEFKEHCENVEKNRERRHAEQMAVLEKNLEIQEKLLKLEEQKLELKRIKISAVAQCVEQL